MTGGPVDNKPPGDLSPEEIARLTAEAAAEDLAYIEAADAGGVNGSPGSVAAFGSLVNRAFVLECFHANELGDGKLFAALHRDRFVYCKNSEEWYEWAGHHWRRDVMGRALAAVEAVVAVYLSEYGRTCAELADLLASGGDVKSGKAKACADLRDALFARIRQLRGTRRRAACLEMAHTLSDPLAVTGNEFDLHPLLLPVANGVLDLDTGLLHPGRPEDWLTLASPVEWRGIDATCPVWERTLGEIFNGNANVLAYFQRLCGYACSGLVVEKVFPVLFGPTGWNGRSLILDTLSRILGALAGPIPAEMLLSQKFARSASGPSPDVMGLKGLRLAIASEIDEGQRFSTGKIKNLTGRDELIGRNPHDKYQTRFQPTHKLFLMTNTQPEAPANDRAWWERVHMIHFPISFVSRDPKELHERRADPDLARKLLPEYPGILAWLVRGFLAWRRHGLKPPVEITAATEEYRRGEDVLADYIEECCLREDGAKGKATDLYRRYVDWYHDNIGEKERSGTWFGKQLKLKFAKSKVNGVIVYSGIRIKDDQGRLEE